MERNKKYVRHLHRGIATVVAGLLLSTTPSNASIGLIQHVGPSPTIDSLVYGADWHTGFMSKLTITAPKRPEAFITDYVNTDVQTGWQSVHKQNLAGNYSIGATSWLTPYTLQVEAGAEEFWHQDQDFTVGDLNAYDGQLIHKQSIDWSNYMLYTGVNEHLNYNVGGWLSGFTGTSTDVHMTVDNFSAYYESGCPDIFSTVADFPTTFSFDFSSPRPTNCVAITKLVEMPPVTFVYINGNILADNNGYFIPFAPLTNSPSGHYFTDIDQPAVGVSFEIDVIDGSTNGVGAITIGPGSSGPTSITYTNAAGQGRSGCYWYGQYADHLAIGTFRWALSDWGYTITNSPGWHKVGEAVTYAVDEAHPPFNPATDDLTYWCFQIACQLGAPVQRASLYAPGNVTISSSDSFGVTSSATGVSGSFSASVSDGGNTNTSFTVTAQALNGGSLTAGTHTGSSISITDTIANLNSILSSISYTNSRPFTGDDIILKISDNDGDSDTIEVSALPGAPAAPSGTTATAASSTSVSVSWTDNSDDETSFSVERKTGSGGTYSVIGTVGANDTSYTDNSLLPSTTYYYRVYASDTGGSSSYSTEVSITTPADAVPTAPTNLISTIDCSGIHLVWEDTSTNETGFIIERQAGSDTNYYILDVVPANTTNYADVSMNPDTSCSYKVKAYNWLGNSSYTGSTSETTGHAPPALAATGLDTNADFEFSISGVNGRVYTLYSSSNLVDWDSLATVTMSGSSMPFTDTNAHNYSYRFYKGIYDGCCSAAIGFITKNAPTNGYVYFDVPFYGPSGNTVASLFPSVPNGTRIYWPNPNGTFITNTYSSGWDTAMTLNPGNAVVLQSPTNVPVTITMMGTVPEGTFTKSIPSESLTLCSSFSPAPGAISDLGYTPHDGDVIYIFDPVSQSTSASYYGDFGGGVHGWDTVPVFGPGDALYIYSVGGSSINQTISVCH